MGNDAGDVCINSINGYENDLCEYLKDIIASLRVLIKAHIGISADKRDSYIDSRDECYIIHMAYLFGIINPEERRVLEEARTPQRSKLRIVMSIEDIKDRLHEKAFLELI